MHLDITEGTVKKGGIGSKPKGVRPSPPKGQGTQTTSNIARAEILPDACTVCRGRGQKPKQGEFMSYVTKNYDFHDAINVGLNRIKCYKPTVDCIIENVDEISDNSALVSTNFGIFYCKSFEDKNANVYMEVSKVLPD